MTSNLLLGGFLARCSLAGSLNGSIANPLYGSLWDVLLDSLRNSLSFNTIRL